MQSSTPTIEPQNAPRSPKIGLALGSGAARGWAHIGVLQALEELGVEPDIYTGASIGALISGAKLLGILEDFSRWAENLSPLKAMNQFSMSLTKGGVLNADPVFEAFRDADRNIEDLPAPFGCVATDLGTGDEVWLTSGSVLNAAKASSAIPAVFQAVSYTGNNRQQWLVDGGLTNPIPVDMCRKLGADFVIAVDINNHPQTIERFTPTGSQDLIVWKKPEMKENPLLPEPVARLISETQNYVEQQVHFAKARLNAKPHLIETAIASFDIAQRQIGLLRAQIDVPDVHILPDLGGLAPVALDKSDDFSAAGYRATMSAKNDILKLKQSPTPSHSPETSS